MTLDVVTASAPLARPSRRRAGTRPQRGVTLLELLIGVGVIIVVMVIVLMGLRSLNAQMDRSALLRQAPQIKVSLAGYGAAADFSRLDTAGAIAMGAFPREMVTGSGADAKVTHPFGGQIHAKGLAQDLLPLKGGRAFSLTYAGIPVEQCAGVARGLAMLGEGLWIDAAVASPPAMPASAAMLRAPGSDAPIDISALARQCSPATGDTVSIHVLMGV
ncbi:hypothetical protein [Mitsuaria sp. 7]|uniref:hypothetical protein n=1 Tax=Mitsuaria sp. 7 TaxID=1658665 RepID=UPI0007DD79A1|nr:hypothetical protein [Mitsuaria sp. 7]ANH67206.1 hypothetical protein ABE85_05810 [Mitsuaria sp. 7]